MNVDINDIDPNSKTIEISTMGRSSIGIIVEGEHKGVCFVKDKHGCRVIENVPAELMEIYKIVKKDA